METEALLDRLSILPVKLLKPASRVGAKERTGSAQPMIVLELARLSEIPESYAVSESPFDEAAISQLSKKKIHKSQPCWILPVSHLIWDFQMFVWFF